VGSVYISIGCKCYLNWLLKSLKELLDIRDIFVVYIDFYIFLYMIASIGPGLLSGIILVIR